MSVKTRREKEKEARAAAIIKEAGRLFLKKGYEDTAVSEIARNLDIAKGTVYLYFPTKEDLFSNVLSSRGKSIFDRLDKSTSHARSAEGALKAYTKAYARARINNAEFFRQLFQSFHRKGGQKSSLELLEELTQRQFDIVRGIIAMGKETGEFRIKNIDETSEHVVALFRGTVIRFHRKAGDGDLERKLTAAASTIINGLRGRKDRGK